MLQKTYIAVVWSFSYMLLHERQLMPINFNFEVPQKFATIIKKYFEICAKIYGE